MITITVTTLSFFFFNDTATTEIYTLSLHDALPIYQRRPEQDAKRPAGVLEKHPFMHHCELEVRIRDATRVRRDRKSTRLNSSHQIISYAVFCLKKKKKINTLTKMT